MKHGKSTRRLVFHIGAERTGTTAIQNYLSSQHERLREQSVLYPTRNHAFFRNNHIRLVASYLPPSPGDHFVQSGPFAKAQILASLKQEIDQSDAETVILSAEHFSSRFGREQIGALAEDFCDYECEIVLFVRDHTTRFYSAYATHIAGGGHSSLEEFANSMLRGQCFYFRYRTTVELWAEHFGAERTHLCLYRPGQNSLEAIADILGFDLEETARHQTLATNKSLGPKRTEILRRFNMALAPRLDGCPDYLNTLAHLGRNLLRHLLLRSPLHAKDCDWTNNRGVEALLCECQNTDWPYVLRAIGENDGSAISRLG